MFFHLRLVKGVVQFLTLRRKTILYDLLCNQQCHTVGVPLESINILQDEIGLNKIPLPRCGGRAEHG